MEETIRHMRKAIDLADGMLETANHAESECDETCVFAVYGIVRDSAYRIKKAAENEFRSLVGSDQFHL
jgi:hypothetical protein